VTTVIAGEDQHEGVGETGVERAEGYRAASDGDLLRSNEIPHPIVNCLERIPEPDQTAPSYGE
jgi:hypothetical protein